MASKTKKPLNIAQRVEILLREGVDKPNTWMPFASVAGIDFEDGPPPVGGDAWEAEYMKLSSHHFAETNFLLDIIRELCEQVKTLDTQLDAQLENDRGIDG